jgi:hypothetical protein
MPTFVLARPNNNKPAGAGGFAERAWDRWRVGDPGRAACGARSKRTGLPCKCLRCYLHVGRSNGRGKRQSPTSMGALFNQETRRARSALEAASWN